jgi:hypothetical protein
VENPYDYVPSGTDGPGKRNSHHINGGFDAAAFYDLTPPAQMPEIILLLQWGVHIQADHG